jgi:hypothetical protein
MRGLRPIVIVAAAICALAGRPGFADAPAGLPSAGARAGGAAAQPPLDLRPIVVGLGAIAGVGIFNVAALGVAALPGGLAYAGGAGVPAEMSVAMSRVYATTSAVAGGWIGYYGAARGGDTPGRAGKDTSQPDRWPSDSRLLPVGIGALAGAAAFNVMTAPLGVVPLAGGALAEVPYSVALGSRLIAVASAGAGALGATWLYDRWTGEASDYRYLVTLGAGALAGVAVGNYLTIGALGVPPYYVGAGAANAAGALASPAAQAASRIYVIGTAVLGAWAADWYSRP